MEYGKYRRKFITEDTETGSWHGTVDMGGNKNAAKDFERRLKGIRKQPSPGIMWDRRDNRFDISVIADVGRPDHRDYYQRAVGSLDSTRRIYESND